jgi:type I restriction-modification system DNA methylase subunit/restriction endonuclease S subunit
MNNDYQSSFFESLHNLLWNDAGLDPQKALEHMTFFFAYRLIEPQVDLLGLPKCCKWSYMANQGDTQKIFDVMKKAVNEFRKNTQTKPYFNPPSINKATLIQRIVEKINELDIEDLRERDTLGNIFEYMLGRGMSTMSDEGQYFTNRKICNLAFELAYEIKKSVRRDDGTLCTFGDFFCGTGGFASAYVNGVKKVDTNVNWQEDKESIYCLDKNLSSVQTTLLNMLITTGVPFNINKIKEHNSFQNNVVYQGLDTAGFFDVEYDFLFMNPPYGGDKSKGKEYRFKYTTGKGKDKQYVVNKEIQSIGIEDDDKVSAGVQLAMALLSKKGGVCCIVLPQGFFFGSQKKQIELRRRIIEEYKIHYVVDIASGEFANTGTKTSMLVFEAGIGSTDIVTFIDMNKDIRCTATQHQLVEKRYGLSCNDYIQYIKVDNSDTDYEIKFLREVVKIDYGKRIVKSQQEEKQQLYDVYGGGGKTFMTDNFNREGVTCKIGRFGVSQNNFVQILHKKYWLHDNGLTIETSNIDRLCNSYLFQYVSYNSENIYKQCVEGRSTCQAKLDIDALLDIQIPLPSLELQKQIVEPIDAWIGMAQAEEKLVKQLEKAVMSHIRVMSMGAPMLKLGDILVQQKGKKYNVSDGKEEGTYPLLRSSKDGKVKWLDTYTFEGPFIAVGTGGIANIHLKNKFNVSTDFLVFETTNETIIDFIYYQLKLRLEYINTNMFQGTTLKHLNRTEFLEMQVPVPAIEDQQILQGALTEIKNKKEMIKLYKRLAQEYIDKSIPKC